MAAPEHRVILLRHGETELSRERRHTGRTDVPLTDEGMRQAAAAGLRLADVPVDRVLVSPLMRARQTCDLAGHGGADAAVEPALAIFAELRQHPDNVRVTPQMLRALPVRLRAKRTMLGPLKRWM